MQDQSEQCMREGDSDLTAGCSVGAANSLHAAGTPVPGHRGGTRHFCIAIGSRLLARKLSPAQATSQLQESAFTQFTEGTHRGFYSI